MLTRLKPLCTALALGLALSACAEDKNPAQNAAGQNAPALNAVAEQVRQNGLPEHCLSRVNNLSNFVIAGGEFAGVTYYAPRKPAANAYSLTLGTQTAEGSQLGFVTLAPTRPACSGSYELVRVWANTCVQVARNVFPDYQYRNDLPGGVALLELNPDEHLYVMPTPGGGCVSVQKGMVFEAE